MDVSGSYGQIELLRSLGAKEHYETYLAKRSDAEGAEGLAVVKRVHGAAAENEDFVNALLDEAGVTGRLKNPSVVGVLDLGEYEGTHFVATEYVPGGTLEELLERRKGEPLLLGDALHLVARLCEGLELAHATQGPSGEPLRVVHGNLKPSNVLLSIDGEVKITDFGMARARATLGEGNAEPPNPYSAPEIAAGEKTDSRTDVYGCGAILHLLTTGEAPRPSDAPAPRSRKDVIEPPSEIRPIIATAMAAAPAKRYPACTSMLGAIARAASGLGVRGDATSLTALVRGAFPVFGGTASVVEAVASAPPEPMAAPGRIVPPATAPAAPPAPLPMLEATETAPSSPAGEADEAPQDSPAEPAPGLVLTPAPPQEQRSPAATETSEQAPADKSPRRKGLIIGLIIAVVTLALLAAAAVVVAVFLVGRAASDVAPVTLTPGDAPSPGVGWGMGQVPPAATPTPTPTPAPGVVVAPSPVAPLPPGTVTYPDGRVVLPPGAPGAPATPTDPAAATPTKTPGSSDTTGGGATSTPTPTKTPEGGAAAPPRDGPRGFLSVLTRPSCRVVVDGRGIGRSPIIRRRIPAGRHRLSLVLDGHEPQRQSITIRAGQLTQINHSFARN